MSSTKGRPKGFISWNPQPHVLDIIRKSKSVMAEYGQYGPMTVRQIFYRLVGEHGYDKTELAYKRLAEYLVRARRAQMISFGSIRDDGGKHSGGSYGYSSVDAFLEDLAEYSTSFHRDPTDGQPHHIIVYCEAEGMVPMLGQMVQPWAVQVTGTGGFSSVTVTHQIALDVVSRNKPTIFLHVGDYDPSGESIYESTCQDIGKFVAERLGARYNTYTGETVEVDGVRFDYGVEGSFFVPRRVALTADQVEEYNLDSSPPKASDSRSASWDGLAATQAESMSPADLDTVIKAAVKEWIDEDRYEVVQREQEEARELVGDRVADAINAVRDELEEES
jgi:hypothetical protein